MKLINGFDLLRHAQQRHYILPAFNTTNLELTYAIARGLDQAGLPGYIQISSHNLRLSSPTVIAAIAREAAAGTEVPIGLHLDHGKSFEDVKACVDAGFTSIMMDASQLPLEENMTQVRRAVEYCHFYGIPVEAELGAIGGKEDELICLDEGKTSPDMVADFTAETGCDTLAVSIGNVHGFDAQPDIDLPLLKQIADISPVPLVLHGGSGIPPEVIKRAKEHRLIKINYGSDIRRIFIRTFGEAYEKNHGEYQLMDLCVRAVGQVSDRVKELTAMINA